ncbi:Ig-like domain-containing protein [Rubricoccus marinus]|uniref:N-acetylmuramoyl-L-alanine amidase n=1 Tax=Rubricoccus marinus TaxID=716817 RepID=A0A259U0F6_9BACT|nr:Ig-like domain-containing protein [Rubricoccus marinus]OZC03505.1 hypothetical protein BSZ36_11240 [Rubricoccus marinus]
MPRLSFFALGLALLTLAPLAPEAQEVTGLSDFSIFLDPGHSQNENVGFAGYSEARKTLRVGLALKDMLETRTDIGGVFMSRTTDQESVSLSQRTTTANASGADYFHSIHSNAAGPTTNYLFVLWAQLPNGNEPNAPYAGGRQMAETMGPNFAEAMRIGTRGTNGGFGECDFYGAGSCGNGVKGSRNFVQRNSLMPSTLSEAGFHTSTTQNPRNMNADWKVLEAQSMFWAILEYNGLTRTPDRIATGIITDGESGIPVNGATVEIAGRSYTTDTYESLFNQYSSDPDLLHNGFYYLPDMPAGTHAVTITAPGYRTATGQIAMLEGEFSFFDAELTSNVPPVVEASTPEADDPAFRITDNIEIAFSRPMDRAATEAAFSLAPASGGDEVAGAFRWSDNDTRMVFDPTDDLMAETLFALTIAGTAEGTAGDALDGNGDGTGGDAFAVTFTSGFPDATPPRIVAVYPANNSTDVERLPLLTLTYSEPIEAATVDGRVSLVPASGGAAVSGSVQYKRLGERSAISFFPDAPLAAGTAYRLEVAPGLRDLFLNEQTNLQRLTFTTGAQTALATVMDNFEGDVADDWWEPQQSGSTTGIVTDSTSSVATDELASGLYGGDSSFRIDYGWNLNDPSWLVRQYRNVSPPQADTFTASSTLRAAVFGDGSGTLFRFAVRDQGSIEVSPWRAIDWIGWRDITWDITADGTGSWISPDGTVDGNAYFDSIQLSYDASAASAPYGQIWVDDLQIVSFTSVAGEEAPEAAVLALGDPYPNPVRTRATVGFTLGTPAPVTAVVYSATGAEVATLASGETWGAGEHQMEWDASTVASGVYFVRIQAAGQTETARLTVVR